MSDFQELKLDPKLIEHLGVLGYRQPTALQREAVPVIARGTTAMGVASAGSGKTLACGLGLAGILDAGSGTLQALVLRPTDLDAAAAAEALHRLLAPSGFTVSIIRQDALPAGQIAVGSPSGALAAAEHSVLKLDGLKSLVVDGASAMLELGAREALETVTALVPKESQRLVLTSDLGSEVADWIDRHARRARRLTYLPAEVEPLADVTLDLFVGPRRDWSPALVRALTGATDRAGAQRMRIDCRFAREADDLAHQLAVRGLAVAMGPEARGIFIDWGGRTPFEAVSLSISWGVPSDLETLVERVTQASRAVVLAEPDELPHLWRLAKTLGIRLNPLKAAPPPDASRSAQATRDQLSDAARDRDLGPYFQLLEPLLEEFTPIELAAAATALLREKSPEAPALPHEAWTRLYFAIGRRDGVRPADLVGAITGESPVTGDRIGRIEIRDTFTSVEVAADAADQVIRGLATATIRGRPANVRVFRE
jgi:ATP-dependent RNA helicase DeaD